MRFTSFKSYQYGLLRKPFSYSLLVKRHCNLSNPLSSDNRLVSFHLPTANSNFTVYFPQVDAKCPLKVAGRVHILPSRQRVVRLALD